MNPFRTQGVHKGRRDVVGRLSSMVRRRDAILIGTWSWPKYPPRPPGYRVLELTYFLSGPCVYLSAVKLFLPQAGSRVELITGQAGVLSRPGSASRRFLREPTPFLSAQTDNFDTRLSIPSLR